MNALAEKEKQKQKVELNHIDKLFIVHSLKRVRDNSIIDLEDVDKIIEKVMQL